MGRFSPPERIAVGLDLKLAIGLSNLSFVGGVLGLAYYRAAGDGQAFPTRERYRVLD